MSKPVYVLGTGLSHDGSSCLLKDGKIIIAIEKERITRKKHDGGNDLLTVQYCLDAAGIGLDDLSLVVQVANFEKESIGRDSYSGPRYFAGHDVPIISISHHLAHAYSATATSPFKECGVLIIDGCGSPYEQCDDLQGGHIPTDIQDIIGMKCEKDSYYHFTDNNLQSAYKDFSAIDMHSNNSSFKLPNIRHSIGGMYSAASNYCFGNMDDAGKLMGLAPYGKDTGKPAIFSLADGRCFVDYSSLNDIFINPRASYEHFKKDFNHYADIAWWVQQEAVHAIRYLVTHRMQLTPGIKALALSGGVALNAVANASILQQKLVEHLYIQPAAGDNGLAIGCAYYGWMKILGQEKPEQQKTVFFGRQYDKDIILQAANKYDVNIEQVENIIQEAANSLAAGKIIGWMQGGAEFGPRALGHRSILVDPRLHDIQLRINRDIKNREDFRPFAPSVPIEHVTDYFEYGYESPYMILTDRIKDKWKDILKGIVHVDGSCRVQTVTTDWNDMYHSLLNKFGELTGIYVLLNTSFNVRGMPIVETPEEAISLLCSTALDELYINNYKIVCR